MIKTRIRKVLSNYFKNKAHLIEALPDDEDIIRTNLFDSFELIMVISLIEKEFKITIRAADLADGNLNSLNTIERFLLNKRDQA